MAKPITDPPGFDEATIEEQLDYLMDLWDRISADPDRVPVRPSHLELAAERLEAHRANPDEGEDGFEMIERLRRKLR
jgi:hypothetical protein